MLSDWSAFLFKMISIATKEDQRAAEQLQRSHSDSFFLTDTKWSKIFPQLFKLYLKLNVDLKPCDFTWSPFRFFFFFYPQYQNFDYFCAYIDTIEASL